MGNLSQHSKVLRELRRCSRSGVPNYRFPQMNILSYTKVISDLRKEKHNIIKERQVLNGKSTGVYYYHLIEGKVEDYGMEFLSTPQPVRKKFLGLI